MWNTIKPNSRQINIIERPYTMMFRLVAYSLHSISFFQQSFLVLFNFWSVSKVELVIFYLWPDVTFCNLADIQVIIKWGVWGCWFVVLMLAPESLEWSVNLWIKWSFIFYSCSNCFTISSTFRLGNMLQFILFLDGIRVITITITKKVMTMTSPLLSSPSSSNLTLNHHHHRPHQNHHQYSHLTQLTLWEKASHQNLFLFYLSLPNPLCHVLCLNCQCVLALDSPSHVYDCNVVDIHPMSCATTLVQPGTAY